LRLALLQPSKRNAPGARTAVPCGQLSLRFVISPSGVGRIAAILRDEGPWKNSAVLANSGGRAKSFGLAESLTRDLGKRHDAEAAGYACTRAAVSLGVWDIISIGSTDFVAVQVKTR
jgi:hypothetical protein